MAERIAARAQARHRPRHRQSSIRLADWIACVRPLGKGLYEVRSSLPSGREARVLFGFRDGMLIALSAFIKKSQATPVDELELARRRLKEMTS